VLAVNFMIASALPVSFVRLMSALVE
jgi:hypothetical protein